jgi:hypothetical protein
MTRAHYLRMAQACGFSMREAMFENIGLVQDMFELYQQANKKEGGADYGSNEDD